MADLTLRLTNDPDPEDLAQIGSQLAAFNDADVGPAARQSLAVLVHEGDELIAGLSGYTAWGWLYVQWLWIDQPQRGKGLAAQILAEAEREARRRLCHGAYIDTFNPQALHVYQKAGYVPFGSLPDFPAGRTRTFLSKNLG